MISFMGLIQSIYNVNFTIYANEINTNSEYKYSGIHSFVRVVGPFSNSLNFSNYLAVGIFLLMYFFNRGNKLRNQGVSRKEVLGIIKKAKTAHGDWLRNTKKRELRERMK